MSNEPEPALSHIGEQPAELEMPLSQATQTPARVLIAGMGNVLQWDDGWGIAVVQELARHSDLPANVRVVEVGTGGLNLVQDLFDGFDALVIVDAAERGGAPGTIYLLQPEIPDLSNWPYAQRQDFLADMHYTNPSKALILARALGVLPPKVFILGCQPASIEGLGIGLSEPVKLGVGLGVERLLTAIKQLS